MPSIGAEWGIDKTTLGGLQSAFYVTYLFFQIPSGVLADWAGPHLFLGGIILAWSASLALHAWAPNYRALYLVRMLFGATQAGCWSSSWRSSQPPAPRR